MLLYFMRSHLTVTGPSIALCNGAWAQSAAPATVYPDQQQADAAEGVLPMWYGRSCYAGLHINRTAENNY